MTRRLLAALLVTCATVAGCESMKTGMQKGIHVMQDVGSDVKDFVITPPSANVLMLPTRGRTDRGTIRLLQKKERVMVAGRITGMKAGEYKLQVHQRGNCSAVDATSAGPVFVPPRARPPDLPATTPWGADLGRLIVEADGIASFAFEVEGIALGSEADSVIGRSLVVSVAGGGVAAPRVACGLVNLSRPD
ncbi:MAG: superoxide dismutase family protein [Burkholderiales bacterium]|jgi:Cu-Zn family superoxide dismutase|nr:superoxide dismutase family protein [Burkholderiales bacterium]